ncbi:MAG: TIGR02679 family protein, partial [Acidimicrobiales bacterium]
MKHLDTPALARLWDRVAERLQRNGLRPAGVIQLDGLDRDERHAIAGLLGRPVVEGRVRVDLG